jgi:hypothetical protein
MLDGPDDLGSLLDRLRATRRRRDAAARHSPEWLEADAELHDIERRIFRLPLARRLDRDEQQTAV